MVWTDILHSAQPGPALSTILDNGVNQPSTKTVLPVVDGVSQPSTNTALPDDGLYHPIKYAGGQNQPIVPNTVAPQLGTQTVVPNTVAPQLDTQTKAATKIPSTLTGLPKVPLPLATAQSVIIALPSIHSIQETTLIRTSQPTFAPTASEDAGLPERSATLLPIPVNAEKLHKSDKSDKSHVYAILSVLAVSFLIALCVIAWLRKQKKKRTAILLRFHNQEKPPLDTSSLNGGQLKTLLSRMKSRGAASIETVIRSARKEHSGGVGTWPMNWWSGESKENQKSGNAHPHTSYKGFDRQLLKDLISQAKRTGVAVYYALSDIILRQREPPKAHLRPRDFRKSRTSNVWSPPININSSAETIFSDFLHSQIVLADASHPVCKCIQEPAPAVLPMQQCLEPICLSEVLSTSDEKVDQLSDNGSSCSVSRVSTTSTRSGPTSTRSVPTSTRSGPKQPTNNVYQDLRPKLSSISLFRKDVYQVQMNYESRNESQLSLSEGENVLITQILDDGWVSRLPCNYGLNDEPGH